MTRQENKAAPAIIFVHIPKTAGTTLHMIIERQYPPELVYTLGEKRSFDDFRNLSETRRAEIRLLRGHMNLGAHEFLPGKSLYITLLRDPIERVISYYYFIRRTPTHYHYDLITSNNLDLLAFLESKADILMANGQTRILSGGAYEYGFGECTQEVLEAAKRNLRERFAVVGLTERFDETLLLLKNALGWRNLFYTPQRVATDRPKRNELAPDTLDAIVEANQLDIELYQYVTMLFAEQIQRQGPPFARQVRSFQLVNPLASSLIHLYHEIRKRSVRVFIRKWIERIRQ